MMQPANNKNKRTACVMQFSIWTINANGFISPNPVTMELPNLCNLMTLGLGKFNNVWTSSSVESLCRRTSVS
jgi:hypothetical protein